jgi:hypothetical protein
LPICKKHASDEHLVNIKFKNSSLKAMDKATSAGWTAGQADGARAMLQESLRTSVQPAWARIERRVAKEQTPSLVEPTLPSTSPPEGAEIDDDDRAFWQRFRDQIRVAVMQLPNSAAAQTAADTGGTKTREDKPMDVSEFMLASKMVVPPRRPAVAFTPPTTFGRFPDIENFWHAASATPTATSHRKVCVHS